MVHDGSLLKDTLQVSTYGLAGVQFDDFYPEIAGQVFKFGGGSSQHGKCSVMNRDNRLGPQQAASVGSFAGSHGEVIANGQQGEVWFVEIVHKLHVAEDRGVAGVVDLQSILEFENVAARVAGVDDLAFVLDAAGVQGVDHGHADICHHLRSAFVHGLEVFNSLLSQPGAELKNSNHRRLVLAGNFHYVAGVIKVAVGDQNYVYCLDVLFVFRAGGVLLKKRINEDDLAAGGFKADTGVTQPGNLETLKIHECLSLRFMIVSAGFALTQTGWKKLLALSF